MSRNREDLHPIIRPYLERLEAAARDRFGIALDLIETWRDAAGQNAAKAAGASNKAAGKSWHNLTLPDGTPASLAFHVDPFPGPPVLGHGPKLLEWPGAVRIGVEMKPARLRPCAAPILILTAIGLLGEELGLTWGGRWDQPQDYLHFELRIGTLSQVQAAMRLHGGDLSALARSA